MAGLQRVFLFKTGVDGFVTRRRLWARIYGKFTLGMLGGEQNETLRVSKMRQVPNPSLKRKFAKNFRYDSCARVGSIFKHIELMCIHSNQK